MNTNVSNNTPAVSTTTREVTPQWASGQNLGVYTVKTVEMPPDVIGRLLAESPKMGQTIARLLNGAVHINGSSKTFIEKLGLRPRAEGEKAADYKAALYDEAKEAAATFAPDMVLNFREMLLAISESERSGSAADPIVKAIREKWQTSDKKSAFLARLGLPAELVTATAEEVESAYLASGDLL